jgi:signal recognition particle subunit SRP54
MTDQRTAIVTGAASGIGRATSVRLASDGWRVVGIDVRDEMPPDIEAIVGDAADGPTFARALGLLNGRLDGLVCAAGLPPSERWEDEQAWSELLRVDLTGPFVAVRECMSALVAAKDGGNDIIIFDTAGRLHIDEMPMDELKQIDRLVRPDQVYMVCDAMTGQDAVNSAKAFNDALELNGVILTKMDGDARGGAALSIKSVAQVPIKFVGVGEKLDKLEPFRPEGMAQRILGRGDIMGLIEKVAQVQKELSQEEIAQQQKKLEEGDFTLDDFRKQFAQLKKMGPMKDVMASMPGMGDMIPEGEDPEDAFRHIQGLIDSMTKEERRNPDVIDINRRRRIAAGSGVEPHDIKQFLGQFEQVRDLMRKMAKMSIWERIKMVTGMGRAGAFSPGASPVKTKGDTGHRKSPKERAKERKNKKKKR